MFLTCFCYILICYTHKICAQGTEFGVDQFSEEHYNTREPRCQKAVPGTAAFFFTGDLMPDDFDPTLRVIKVSQRHNDASANSWIVSKDLEVFVTQGRLKSVTIDAPNLRAFTAIDIGLLIDEDMHWNFPRLRVLNIISFSVRVKATLRGMNSRELEVLRLLKAESANLGFTFTQEFAKLRIFEFSQIGFGTSDDLCPFLIQLVKLEQLLLFHVQQPCVIETLQELSGHGKLRIVRLLDGKYIVPAEELCLLFPPRVQHLQVELFNSPPNTTLFECYKLLKTFHISYMGDSLNNVTAITDSFSAISKKPRTDCPLELLDVKRSVVLRLSNLFSGCTTTPSMPKALILSYTENGFSFAPGVEAFPDAANVRVLDLSANPIGFIPQGAFDRLPKLGIVILQETKLTGFHDLAFCNLRWPRVINFHLNLPNMIRLTQPVLETKEGYNNSLSCLVDGDKVSNIIFDNVPCDCKDKRYRYVQRAKRNKRLGMDNAICKDEEDYGQQLFTFYEEECGMKSDSDPGPEPLEICTNAAYAILLILSWIMFVLLCLIPPVAFYCLHHRAFKQNLLKEQQHRAPKRLFIICPHHSRKWCKKVLIPLFEADLFAKRAPHLRPVRLTSGRSRSRLSALSGDQENNQSGSANRIKPPNHTDDQKRIPSPASSMTTMSESNPQMDNSTKPSGPWAWQPRFTCFLCPPARHRLSELMQSSQVLIVFASSSLFTEPACRAQIRLAFHLARLGRTPPPAILVWPTNRFTSRISDDYRTVNRDTHRLDYDKYYPALEFDSVTNEPDDVAEICVIKAKVPSREETVKLVQFFATSAGPFVEWNNAKTARENLSPLVWMLNKASRIPAY